MLAHDEKSKFFMFHTKLVYHIVRNVVGFFLERFILIPENDEIPCGPRDQRKRRRFGVRCYIQISSHFQFATMRKQRRKNTLSRRNKAQLEANKKRIKNLSNKQLTESQINLLAKGLKFIPTPGTKVNQIRQQLLRDFEQFARRMRLQYMHYCAEKKQRPFYVKSNWNPPMQQSVALESYLEEVKISPGGYSLIWAIWGRAAGQGMVFGLAVLNRVYNLTCLCPEQVKNLS